MTNSSLKGKSAAVVNPYAKKPVISNPYAKKQPSAVKTVLPVKNNAKQAHNISNTKRVAAVGTASKTAGPVATYSSSAKRPQSTVSRKAVTPTPPKKKLIPHKHGKPGLSSISKATPRPSTGNSNNTARAVASSYNTPKATAPIKALNKSSMPNTKLMNAPRKMTTAAGPTIGNTSTHRPQSLKQSLKSQIAQIKRRKQLLLQQKEAEKYANNVKLNYKN